MAELKPAYLVHGDDDARIDAWRLRLRRRAETERGPGGLEAFDGSMSSPPEVAAALSALTFDTGTRFVLVDDAGAWKAADLEPLEAALREPPAETVLVLIVRGKPLKQLVKLVEGAGGEVREEAAPRAAALPRWVVERAREQGIQLDPEGAKALIALVGPGQQRLAREVEKLALAVHPAGRAGVEDVERIAAADAAPQAYELADALAAGDLGATMALAEELETHGERPGRLMFPIVRRLREVHQAAAMLESGATEQQAAQALKAPPWLAKRIVSRARKADRSGLERALCAMAELEVELRGGGDRSLDEDTAFSLALARAVP